MTTASEGVAVIATQLAQTDRRALSEAWYSALHLAREAAPAHAAPAHGAAPAAPLPAAPRSSRSQDAALPLASARTQSDSLSSRAERPRARSRGTATTTPSEPTERRRPPSEVTKRIERAVATLGVRRPLPAAHTVDIAGGRVRLLVHSDGRKMRIVALCSPTLRDQVERALARARFTLAAGGIAVGAP